MRKILLASGGITLAALLFYIALGDGVAFYTQVLYNDIYNLIAIGIMMSQFFLHLLLLIFIKPKQTHPTGKTSRENKVLWIYVAVAFAVNVVIILMGTSDSRAVMSTERKWDNTEKYNWNAGISCPEGYPVYVLDGRFTIKSWSRRNNFPSFGSVIRFETWGEGNSGAFGDESTLKTVMPDSLLVTWYAVMEDKFYDLAVAVDKKKIMDLFRKGFDAEYPAGRFHGTYSEITAGLAPGGNVVVWVNSIWQNSVEVGLYKAKQIDTLVFDKYTLINLRSALAQEKADPKSTLYKKTLPTKSTIPFSKWTDQYRTKYNWKFLFEHELELDESDVRISMFNGERLKIDNTSLSEADFSMKALPSEISFVYLSKTTGTERPYVLLDESEVYYTFRKLAENNPKNPISLTCKMNKAGEITSVIVSNGKSEMGLKLGH